MTNSMNSVSQPHPGVFIDPMVRRKIMHWVHKAGDKECSGLGGVVVNENGQVCLVEAFLVDQVSTSGDTELDAMAVCKALYAHKDKPYQIRCWWHSHHRVAVFWSGTDAATIRQLGKEDWFLNIVFNSKGETRTCIYGKQPFEFCFDDIPLRDMVEYIHPDILKTWDDEFTLKVKEPVYKGKEFYGWEKDAKGNWQPCREEPKPGEAGAGRSTLSKKAQKRLAKQTQKSLALVSGEKTGIITGSDLQALIEEQRADDADDVGNEEEQPLPCIVCGLRYQCMCDKQLKQIAWEWEGAGQCWQCEQNHNACACSTRDIRDTRAEEITERILKANKKKGRPKGSPPFLAGGVTNGVG